MRTSMVRAKTLKRERADMTLHSVHTYTPPPPRLLDRHSR